MSNLGRQWSQPELSYTVHRGLHLSPGEPLNLEKVGTHWTVDRDISHSFTSNPNIERGRGKKRILSAEVPMSSLEFDTKRNKLHTEGYPEEQEILVKHGAPVTLTGVTTVTKGGGETAKKFKKPKETRA